MSSGIPQGIEVLVGKASVDPEFRAILLEQRAQAADLIGLTLEPAEAAMLAAVPPEQLEAIIARTSVPPEHRRAFLGHAAAAMLAAVGAIAPAASAQVVQGIGPDRPATKGIRPDLPPGKPKEPTVEERAIEVVARLFKIEKKDITRKTSFVDDLNAQPEDLVKLKSSLEKQFKLRIPPKEYKNLRTVGQTVDWVEKTLKRQAQEKLPLDPGVTRGTRPDLPPASGLGGIRPK